MGVQKRRSPCVKIVSSMNPVITDTTTQPQGNAMQQFIEKYKDQISGVLAAGRGTAITLPTADALASSLF